MVISGRCTSWGGSKTEIIEISRPGSAVQAVLPFASWLPVGAGRSYGNTCLPAGAHAIDTRSMNRVLAFDAEAGVFRAESGITFHEIIDVVAPQGWFVPVTPGTGYITLGGAIANDVHGKNHHNAGNFGCHVRRFELLRSDGVRLVCSPQENAELFAATVGGMGLTGLILWAEITLMRAASPDVEQETRRFASIDEFFAGGDTDGKRFTYSVAWLDAMARGRNLGRGLVLNGNHATQRSPSSRRRGLSFNIPVAPPFNLVRRPGLRVMNALYYRQPVAPRRVAWFPYFYPLDAIGNWNVLYGPRGFHQFQCVVPVAQAGTIIPRLLETSLSRVGGSGLAVLKRFGDIASPGLLSFPASGYTLTLDFADRGEATSPC